MGSTYGEGLAAGINSGVGNLMQGVRTGMDFYLANRRQKTYEDYADMQRRQQAAELGMLAGQRDDGAVPPATVLARSSGSGQGAQFVPAGSRSGQYTKPSIMGEVGPSPEPSQKWNDMGEVGLYQQGQPAAPGMAQPSPEDMTPEQIQELYRGIGQRRRESELGRMDDLDMLRPAFHYKEKLAEAKPYMDMLAGAMREIKANPQNPEMWRKAMAIMGTDDPEMAGEAAIQQYMDYQRKFTDLTSKYNALSQSLATRGITPDMYGDEERFIKLQNELQYRGRRSQRRSVPGAGILGRPNLRRR